MGMLKVSEVAALCAWSERTAHRYVEAWAGAQRDARVPRVTLTATGGRGRPGYRVDADSLRRWRVPANTNTVANDI